jgi:hypothetical protein
LPACLSKEDYDEKGPSWIHPMMCVGSPSGSAVGSAQAAGLPDPYALRKAREAEEKVDLKKRREEEILRIEAELKKMEEEREARLASRSKETETRVRLPDGNVIHFSMSSLAAPAKEEEILTGDRIECQDCAAMLNVNSKVVPGDEDPECTNFTWECEFCGSKNDIILEEGEKPVTDLVEEVMQAPTVNEKLGRINFGEKSKIIYCIDIRFFFFFPLAFPPSPSLSLFHPPVLLFFFSLLLALPPSPRPSFFFLSPILLFFLCLILCLVDRWE